MPQNSKRKMGLSGVIFFLSSGLIGIDILAPAAAIGPSVFGWWVIVLTLFVIPYILIVCELSSTFPSEGAIYDWTLRGMGKKSAARISWYYWINVPFWIPSIFLVCVGMIKELFFPQMSTWVMIVICIAMLWAAIIIINASLNISTFFNAIGGISKVTIVLALAAGGYLLFSRSGVHATSITLSSMMPNQADSLKYVPTLVYTFLGIETISCMGDSIKRPERNLPLGIIITMFSIICFYFMATTSMIVAVPRETLSLVGGVVQTLEILFSQYEYGHYIVIMLTLVASISLFPCILPWIMASARTAKEAADAGEMPKIFSKVNRHDSPYAATILTGVVASGALIIYGIMAENAEELFWTLFSFSSFLLFLTYFFFFISFYRLRAIAAEVNRPFKIPGGKVVAFLIALVPSLVLFFGCILFLFPDLLSGKIDGQLSSILLISVIIAVALIEFSIYRCCITRSRPNSEIMNECKIL